jgi:hypothetical protein
VIQLCQCRPPRPPQLEAHGVSGVYGTGTRSTHSMSRTIYCGNLPGGIREREVEDVFYKVR